MFLLCYNLYIHVSSDLVYHYCISNILQRIKNVNKIRWYKQLFFQIVFMFFLFFNLKPVMYIAVIWLSSYSSFFFLFNFQCFSSVCFLLFFDVFCTPPHNQENHDFKKIRLKHDVNTRLLESSVNWEKNIDFSLCIVALYVKAFRPYIKHLIISYCMCNVLKAFLSCKCVTNFRFAVVLMASNNYNKKEIELMKDSNCVKSHCSFLKTICF